MPVNLQPFALATVNQLQVTVVHEGRSRIHQGVIEACGDGLPGQAFADAPGNLQRRRSRRDLLTLPSGRVILSMSRPSS